MIPSDQLPRVFQANLDRLFQRVILPAMDALIVHPILEPGEADSLEEFLDRAAAQVDNYTANEAAKSFVLMLAAVFERQLSIWARLVQPENGAKRRLFQDHLLACAEAANIDLVACDLGAELTEIITVANVVRHGEGPACERLRAIAPRLWPDQTGNYVDLAPGPRLLSETLRISKNDLIRYVRAMTRFWGRADPLPMAVTDPPYWLS
ncbi:hypothetical protein RsS62_53380 [Rhizobium dioscoreae]|uniref:hypothetical protein n=1 Tax=Rhizobium dioscoreae TaxID=2653122 RepID=UPI00126114A2|nr:hypothetical protein [Rhizobium dioscoreae]GES46086.1 hypothetical protein RsS62_53380 [Rhizobium dioscoreae]